MNGSKPLRSVDADGKRLVMALRDGQPIYGINVDSFYWTPEGWLLIELQKCVNYSPRVYDLNRCWYMCWRKYALLWKLATALRGRLFIVYYEILQDLTQVKWPGNYPDHGYGAFKVHQVTDVNIRDGLGLVDLGLTTYWDVRKWYNELSASTAEAFPFTRDRLAWEPRFK